MKRKLLILAIPVLLMCGGIVYVGFNNNQGEVTSFTPEFEEAQTQEIEEAQVSKGIKIPGYSTIPIAANSEEIEVDLHNPEENDVYFQITFLLTDTKEQIYQSKLIEPGQHLYNITLDRALEVGDYDLTIQYDTFSTDGSYTPKNGASVNCILSASA